MTTKGGVVTFSAPQVPEPLPGMSYSLVADAARDRGVPIRIASADGARVVTFDADGHSEEPPF